MLKTEFSRSIQSKLFNLTCTMFRNVFINQYGGGGGGVIC